MGNNNKEVADNDSDDAQSTIMDKNANIPADMQSEVSYMVRNAGGNINDMQSERSYMTKMGGGNNWDMQSQASHMTKMGAGNNWEM